MKLFQKHPNLGSAFVIALGCKIALALASLLTLTWTLGFWLPLAVMLAYLWHGHQQTKDKTRGERLNYGDSCYYLGFLFTVASLIIALLDIGIKGELTVADVAIRFGAAMVTTLLGMAIRVWLVTFAEKENKAETEGIYVQGNEGTEFVISASMENLKNFNNALAENFEYTKKLRENLQLLAGRISNDQKEAIDKIVVYGEELMQMTRDNINATHAEFKAKLDEEFTLISDQLKTIVTNSSEGSKRLVDESLKHVDSMAQSALKGLESELKDVSTQLNSVVKSNIENTDSLMRGSITQIETVTKSALSGIETMGNQISKDLAQSINDSAGHIKSISNKLEEDKSKFMSSSEAMAQSLTSASQQIAKDIDGACSAFTQTTNKASSGFDQELSGIKSELSNLKGAVSTVSHTTNALAEEIEKSSGKLSSSVESLTTEAEKLESKLKAMPQEKRKRFLGIF